MMRVKKFQNTHHVTRGFAHFLVLVVIVVIGAGIFWINHARNFNTSPNSLQECSKLSSALKQLAESEDPETLANSIGIILNDDGVLVEIALTNQKTDAIFDKYDISPKTKISENLRFQQSNILEAYVPVEQLCQLSNEKEVLSIRQVRFPQFELSESDYNQNSWKEIVDDSCVSFFDGCNVCNRKTDGSVICTKKACSTYERPQCLDADQSNKTTSEKQDYVDLFERLETNNRIAVIVSLNVDLDTDSLVSPDNIESIQKISDTQDAVIDLLQGTNFEVYYKYRLSPILAVWVDIDALDRLTKSELVKEISEDLPIIRPL